jgi:hypothetical protein
MKQSELHNQLFNTILKAAVEENLMQSLEAIPSEKELEKEYTPLPESQRNILNLINREYKKSRHRKALRTAKRAAVIAVIMLSIVSAGLLSVEASRTYIYNAILQWKSDHVNISFGQENFGHIVQDTDVKGNYVVGYIPKGFYVKEKEYVGPVLRITYQNQQKESILFDQTPIKKRSETIVDTENLKYSEITINGYKGYVFNAKLSGDKNIVLWQDKKTILSITSLIDEKEMIKMAENIR